ncbi:MAG: hypothetical protein Q9174_005642 [Haloplaca sp. 1 TL-2023]
MVRPSIHNLQTGTSIAGALNRLIKGKSKHHVYVSQTHNVSTNLAIEHYLFKNTQPDSTALYLYVNQPSIVIGRNQNPWLEVNHASIRQGAVSPMLDFQEIKLIRRTSGGGTVFHDQGNVNFSVICPPAAFHRDKHAEMVVRAIRKSNPRARVNARHDIVLDPGPLLDPKDHPDPQDTHRTPYAFDENALVPGKISGSAYKITRDRAMHHGTCLLNSPNLSSISNYLHSPARPFMKGRGVDSVRSRVANIADSTDPTRVIDTATLQSHIVESFAEMYDLKIGGLSHMLGLSHSLPQIKGDVAIGPIEEKSISNTPGISDLFHSKGAETSQAYLYESVPKFTLSSHKSKDDDRERPPLPQWFPYSAKAFIKADKGIITSSHISTSPNPAIAAMEQTHYALALEGKKIHEIPSFRILLLQNSTLERIENEFPDQVTAKDLRRDVEMVSRWLDLMFGKEYDP